MEETKKQEETTQLGIGDVSISMCQHCRKVEGEWVINPYVDEIYNEEVWEYICPDCYHELCMDV